MNAADPPNRVKIADVARAAGVSKTLASFALNDKPGVSAKSKARILAVANELGYKRDPFALALRAGQSNTYGFVVRNLRNAYFLDVIDSAQNAANALGATLVTVNSDFSSERELTMTENLADNRIAGLAITPIGDGPGLRYWHKHFPDAPTVVINSINSFGSDLIYVTPDLLESARLAARHLAELGHRRIALLTPPAEASTERDRISAFLSTCVELGVVGEMLHAPLSFEAVRAECHRLFRSGSPVTGIVTNSDYTAHAVVQAARDYGLRIGRELSIIGHDDLATSPLLDPPLTSIRYDLRMIGQKMFLRLARAEKGNHVEPVELIPRASSGPPVPRR